MLVLITATGFLDFLSAALSAASDGVEMQNKRASVVSVFMTEILCMLFVRVNEKKGASVMPPHFVSVL